MPARPSADAYCPRCSERVRVFWPYGKLVAIASLLVAIGTLALFRVRSVLAFAAGTFLIWVPLSLYLRLASARYGPPILKRRTERNRTEHRRTFFEWLYDRNAPRDIFDKNR